MSIPIFIGVLNILPFLSEAKIDVHQTCLAIAFFLGSKTLRKSYTGSSQEGTGLVLTHRCRSWASNWFLKYCYKTLIQVVGRMRMRHDFFSLLT